MILRKMVYDQEASFARTLTIKPFYLSQNTLTCIIT